MKVDQARRSNVSNTKRSKSTIKSGEMAFTAVLDGEIKTERPSPSVKVATLDAIVPIDSATIEEQHKNLAKGRAVFILDRLEDIRQGLLLGAISQSGLQELARTIREARGETLDPKMSDILDDIELRAKIELAKLEQN
ncbi:MAG: flagellar assembly protein FliX [Pseudomonadota bacterium]|nr:flagellar assembly protein FliX [Pseudomonadota bacterium]